MITSCYYLYSKKDHVYLMYLSNFVDNNYMKSTPSLAITHPKIAAQWHPTKNGDLTPYKVSFGSSKKVWWKCSLMADHEWQSKISTRTSQGHGCSCCAGKTVVPSNSFAINYPKLAVEWHPMKNGDLTPFDVLQRSNKKVWWKCSVAGDHEWKSSPDNRVRGRGCPYCSGTRICLSNSFGFKYPNLILEWHVIKNGELTPYDLTAKSGIRVWWKCLKGHEWKTNLASRAYGRGCPICADIQWSENNGGHKVTTNNCLTTTHPELLTKWHPTKNTITTQEVSKGSNKKVWWKCPVADDHEWEATINSIDTTDDKGCPCCYGIKVVKSNCLATTHPEVVQKWHPTKNGNLTPHDVLGGGYQKVWWKCPVADDHEWEATINNVLNGSGCPCCCGRKPAVSNCLATVRPDIAKLWHSTKNGNLTPSTITAFTNRKAWWKCLNNHEWIASIANVSTGSGCPTCNVSKGEKKIVEFLSQACLRFEREHKFATCRDKIALRFDFVVYQKDQVSLIEFQGQQHYEPVSFGGQVSKDIIFEYVRRHDLIKREWCVNNNIPLLEIPYWDIINIPMLIKDFLKL